MRGLYLLQCCNLGKTAELSAFKYGMQRRCAHVKFRSHSKSLFPLKTSSHHRAHQSSPLSDSCLQESHLCALLRWQPSRWWVSTCPSGCVRACCPTCTARRSPLLALECWATWGTKVGTAPCCAGLLAGTLPSPLLCNMWQRCATQCAGAVGQRHHWTPLSCH